ncbi:MAG: hypothetical protein ACMXYL_01765 [Candidatus Woesearchaeota archaeon]
MKKNMLVRDLMESGGISEYLIREFTHAHSFPLVMDLVYKKRNIQVSLDYEDVEICFSTAKYIENYSLSMIKPKRFTKSFWSRLTRFLFNSTLYARSGIFMIETSSHFNDRELSLIAEFYSEFSERYLQDADFFVGIGIKVNPNLKNSVSFHSLSFYPKSAKLCQSCYQKVAKFIIREGEEHYQACERCSHTEKPAKRKRRVSQRRR